MRIVQITQSYPPMVSGAAIVAQRLAEALSGLGHEVLVLAASDTGRDYVTTRPHCRLRRLASLPNPFRVGQRFVLWPRRAMLAEFKAFQPEIIHSQDLLGLGLIGIRAARSMGAASLITAHQLPWFAAAYLPDLPGLRRAVEEAGWAYARWLARHCDRLVVPSRAIAGIIQAHGIELPAVVGNGIDPRFSPIPDEPGEAEALRRKYGLDPDLPIILFVGRIDADKKVELIVQAAARLFLSQPGQLLIVGDGTRRQAVMELSRALGISGRAIFPGYVPASGDLPGLFRLASAYVTVGEIEVQPLTILEAHSSGLPVVTVRTSAMSEMIQDGVTGFLVPPGDAGALAERLAGLLRDPDCARAMGMAGQAAAQRFSEQRMAQDYAALYESLRA